MNKKTYLRILLAILCILMLSGCQQNDPDDYTLPEPEWVGVVSVSYTIPPRARSIEEYEKRLEAEYIPDSFIYYDDISFVGDFDAYWGEGTEPEIGWTVERYHRRQVYALADENGSYCLTLRHLDEARTLKNDLYEREEMPQRESFYRSPSGDDGNYQYGNMLYSYREGNIVSILWYFGKYRICIEVIDIHPDVESDAFVSRLLHADTAVVAKNQLNRAIFWRQIRVAMKKAAPIAIPVVCVLAVGISVLVYYRRKKRKSRTAEPE